MVVAMTIVTELSVKWDGALDNAIEGARRVSRRCSRCLLRWELRAGGRRIPATSGSDRFPASGCKLPSVVPDHD